MSERREIVEVEGRDPLMERLLLAQGFDTVCAPSWIEFTFFNAVSRRKTHQGGANESAAEAETHKEQQAAKAESKQIRGFFGLDHFAFTQIRVCPCVPPTRRPAGASNNVFL